VSYVDPAGRVLDLVDVEQDVLPSDGDVIQYEAASQLWRYVPNGGAGAGVHAPVVFQPQQFLPDCTPLTPFDLLGVVFTAGGPNVSVSIASRDAENAVIIEPYRQCGTGSIAFVVGSLMILRGITGIPDRVNFDVDVSLATSNSVYGIVLRNPSAPQEATYAGWLRAGPPA
jgi:hypothetical protein